MTEKEATEQAKREMIHLLGNIFGEAIVPHIEALMENLPQQGYLIAIDVNTKLPKALERVPMATIKPEVFQTVERSLVITLTPLVRPTILQ